MLMKIIDNKRDIYTDKLFVKRLNSIKSDINLINRYLKLFAMCLNPSLVYTVAAMITNAMITQNYARDSYVSYLWFRT